MTDDSKPTTVRIRPTRRQQLEQAAHVLNRTQSEIVDEALELWLRENKLLKRYQLNVGAGHTVLLEINNDVPHIRDVRVLNGVPIDQIAREYSITFNAPIHVVTEP